MPILKRIKPGCGYWETTAYPIGGCFRRAGIEGVGIVSVVRGLADFKSYTRYGCDEEGMTEDGRKVCYSFTHIEPVQQEGEQCKA